jgi:hypothetical protein
VTHTSSSTSHRDRVSMPLSVQLSGHSRANPIRETSLNIVTKGTVVHFAGGYVDYYSFVDEE